jgi:hypothetical protein
MDPCMSANSKRSTSIVHYNGRKITDSLGKVTVRGEKDGKARGSEMANSLPEHVYINENIYYYSQLSSVAILLLPEPNRFHNV